VIVFDKRYCVEVPRTPQLISLSYRRARVPELPVPPYHPTRERNCEILMSAYLRRNCVAYCGRNGAYRQDMRTLSLEIPRRRLPHAMVIRATGALTRHPIDR
jgi:hypothetical protein